MLCGFLLQFPSKFHEQLAQPVAMDFAGARGTSAGTPVVVVPVVALNELGVTGGEQGIPQSGSPGEFIPQDFLHDFVFHGIPVAAQLYLSAGTFGGSGKHPGERDTVIRIGALCRLKRALGAGIGQVLKDDGRQIKIA